MITKRRMRTTVSATRMRMRMRMTKRFDHLSKAYSIWISPVVFHQDSDEDEPAPKQRSGKKGGPKVDPEECKQQ